MNSPTPCSFAIIHQTTTIVECILSLCPCISISSSLGFQKQNSGGKGNIHLNTGWWCPMASKWLPKFTLLPAGIWKHLIPHSLGNQSLIFGNIMSVKSYLIIVLLSISLVISGSCAFSHTIIGICIFLLWIAYSCNLSNFYCVVCLFYWFV